jgi:CelD/BcsL family acetyltransferase involved in cellulose biosynthesis
MARAGRAPGRNRHADEGGTVRASVVRPGELGTSERQRWHDLAASCLDLQNPFLTPEFARAVDRVSDDARVAVFEDGGRIVGFLPFELRAHRIGTAIGRQVNTRQGFVHEPGLQWSWPGVLHATALDVLELSDLVAGQNAAGHRSMETVEVPQIDTRVGWDEYLRDHKKVFKTPRYQERRLKREFEDVLFRSGPSKDPDEIRQLIAWKSQQYRLSGWPDPFARRGVPALLEMLAEDRETGLNAVVSSLYVDERLVATDLSLTTGTVFAGWFAAHDPDFSRFSPGAIRTLRTIEAVFDRGTACFDLSRGDERYKHQVKTSDGRVATGIVSRRSLRAGAYRAARAPVAAVRSYVLARPRLRSTVRESLRMAGRTRERLTRATA